MDNREALIREVRLHHCDTEYGSPLNLGEITIAMHAADCPRCAYLAKKAALQAPCTCPCHIDPLGLCEECCDGSA